MIQIETYDSAASHIHETLHKVFNIHRASYQLNPLFEIGDYTLAARGKMLRGILLLQACRAVGGTPEQAIHAAAGTEYGHLASLVHDDMIDRDEMRRGQPTVWSAYGFDQALLTGDLFIFEAYHSLSLCRHWVPAERVVRVLEVLSRACIDLCLGQAREAQLTGDCSASLSDYTEMIRQKTASLFRAALESGAILGGGTEKQIAAVSTFGDQLGIAFQVVDDVLCYTVQEATLLKPPQSDIKNRRVTLPILYALQSGSASDRQVLQGIFEHGDYASEPHEAMRLVTAILCRTGALQQAHREAERLQANAIEQLDVLSQNEGKDFLLNIAELAVKRER